MENKMAESGWHESIHALGIAMVLSALPISGIQAGD